MKPSISRQLYDAIFFCVALLFFVLLLGFELWCAWELGQSADAKQRTERPSRGCEAQGVAMTDTDKEMIDQLEGLASNKYIGPIVGKQLLVIRDRLAELSEQDDTDRDCTDAAHQAWWRGETYGFAEAMRAIEKILNCEHDGHGVANEPWEPVRRRLLELVERASVVHKSPSVGDVVMPCCGKMPFEVPRLDRITLDNKQVTCREGSVPREVAESLRDELCRLQEVVSEEDAEFIDHALDVYEPYRHHQPAGETDTKGTP